MLPDLLPGDIILSRSKTWISKTIRFFSKLQSGDARVSHAVLVLGDGLVIESLVKIRINELAKYKDQTIVIYRLKDHSDSDRESVRREALKVTGNTYGLLKLPLFVLDSFSSVIRRRPVYFFTQTFGITNFQVCSNFVAWIWRTHGNHIWPIDWRSISPDYLDDWCSRNADLIYSSL